MAKSKGADAQVASANTNGKQQKPTKKKNDPLRPQPAWLFPKDEDNPVLNPKKKSPEEEQKEVDARLAAIKFLEYKSVTAPVKEPPPGVLMQLIGAFFTAYGFNNTGRIFSIERDARRTINAWDDAIGEKFEKGTPSLVQIFKRWQREWELEQAELKATKSDETSSEEDSSDESVSVEKPAKKSADQAKKAAQDSDSSSEDDSDSDSEEEKAALTKTSKKTAVVADKTKKRKSSSSDSDDDSDSDSSSADDSDAPSKKRKIEADGKGAKKITTTVKTNGVQATKIVKSTPSKVEKTTVLKPAAESSDSSDADSDSDDSSDSSDDENAGVKTNGTSNAVKGKKASPAVSNASTDSTSTLSGEPAKKDASSSSETDDSSDSSDSSEDEAPAAKKSAKVEATQKRKRSKSPVAASTPVSAAKLAKKSNEPFSRIPKDQYVDPRLTSNKYVPYDYAQKAHEDLIVTKGKGFTKEKNKKKRGS